MKADDVPIPLTAVSRNGTIGLDAWISILANRSRRSLRHRWEEEGRQGRVSQSPRVRV